MLAHKVFKFRNFLDTQIYFKFNYFLFGKKHTDIRPYNWYKELLYALFLIFV